MNTVDSKSVIFAVLAENSICPSRGIFKTLVHHTAYQIRIKLTRLKQVIHDRGNENKKQGTESQLDMQVDAEGSAEFNDYDTSGFELLDESESVGLNDIDSSDVELLDKAGSPVLVSPVSGARMKGVKVKRLRGRRMVKRAMHSKLKTKRDSPASREVPHERDSPATREALPKRDYPATRKALDKLFVVGENRTSKEKPQSEKTQQESVQDEGIDPKEKSHSKLIVNLGDLSDDVNMNPVVVIRRMNESEIMMKKMESTPSKTAPALTTRSGRTVKRKTWTDHEVGEIPVSTNGECEYVVRRKVTGYESETPHYMDLIPEDDIEDWSGSGL